MYYKLKLNLSKSNLQFFHNFKLKDIFKLPKYLACLNLAQNKHLLVKDIDQTLSSFPKGICASHGDEQN